MLEIRGLRFSLATHSLSSLFSLATQPLRILLLSSSSSNAAASSAPVSSINILASCWAYLGSAKICAAAFLASLSALSTSPSLT
eukprot:CAMPEP_0173390876 /NCGR_PEP_ID=MMETSP1356-20130122/16422_1 /TAXON_ID=77927 ORGANISM="Hemiselmis virescens, Strain PCC157" /NCGR_SAMPLE_ID=MMETSP1356 /ASSEMBLY_ACC=CAM_ASM_000847 /LENGTH=83 /DNA_ID=CAMNT_0014348371 /DNA_START=121 /DNA_END=368 /DNA_ORIENTATION=-